MTLGISVNKYECTVDQELYEVLAGGQLADAAAYAPDRRCTHKITALFCVKWRHDHHLKSVT